MCLPAVHRISTETWLARISRIREKEEAKRDERMAKERQKDVDSGKDAVDHKFKALEYLLSQSKVSEDISMSSRQDGR